MDILLNTIMLEPRRWASSKLITTPLIELLPAIRKAGFKKLEIWGYHIWNVEKEEFSRLSGKLLEENMVVPSIGSYLTHQGDPGKGEILRVARRYFSICEKLRSERLRIFYGSRDFRKSSHDYLQFIDSVFEEILKMGQDRGIKIMAEMHGGTVIGDIEGLKRVMDKWGGFSNFGLVYQPYEFKTGPALKALDASLGHVQSVHLQNRHNGHFTGLAEGDVDYRRILNKLASSCYGGPFVLEFTAGISSHPENFDCRRVLNSAAEDKEWLESIWRKVNG